VAPGGIRFFGWWFGGVGDLDGNGRGDVLVQGQDFRGEPEQSMGTMFAIDGGTREVIYTFWNEGRERCGYGEIGPAGDMDGDDFPDFYLSSFCSTGIIDDRVEVFSGAPVGVRTLANPCDPEAKRLRIGATGVPRIGTHYRFHLTGIAPGVEARLLVGTQPPRTLDGFRVRRCPGVTPVQILPALSKPLRAGEGVASVTLPIPNRAELIGSKCYAQWVVRDGERPLRSRILELELQPTSPSRER
jgi:hypothetical protein